MAKILDNILCTLMVFVLTFAWTVYCLRDLQLALALASLVALCACYIFYKLLTRSEIKRNTKKKQNKLLADFAIFLRFNTDNSALFSPLFCYYKYITTSIDYDNIIVSKDKQIYVAFCYRTDSVSAEEMQRAVVEAKREKCSELLIFCNKIDSGLQALADTQIPTQFVDLANTYELFEHAEKLPNIPQTKAKKQHLAAQIAFNKKRFKWYFFGAVYSLIISFFSYLKPYLLGWATAMFCLALYSILNRRYNAPPTSFSLDKM